MTTQLRWGLSTDVGRVRSANQDSAMANGALFVVADGMGGHQGGEVASAITIQHFVEVSAVGSVDELAGAVDQANELIRRRASGDPELDGMGTTVVALARLGEDPTPKLAVANVGDSRMYRLDIDGLTQLTDDHSLVAELHRAGQLTEEEAARHPQRNVLTRALGVDQELVVDRWVYDAEVGHRYMLCSDGLINEVPDDDIASTLRGIDDPSKAADTLVAMANDAGGRDNTTVLIVDVIEADECDPDETPS